MRKRTVKEGGGDALRKIVEEDLPELAGQHRTPCSGEAHFKTDDQIGGGEFTGCANQNLLPRTTHPDETALSGTAGLKGEASRCPAEATQDMIRQRRALIGRVQIGFRKTGPPAADQNAQAGGRSERIPLHMVDGKDIIFKVIGPARDLYAG